MDPFACFFAICSKIKEAELGKKLPYDFRPGVNLQGKITPDPQLHMDPQIIPTPAGLEKSHIFDSPCKA